MSCQLTFIFKNPSFNPFLKFRSPAKWMMYIFSISSFHCHLFVHAEAYIVVANWIITVQTYNYSHNITLSGKRILYSWILLAWWRNLNMTFLLSTFLHKTRSCTSIKYPFKPFFNGKQWLTLENVIKNSEVYVLWLIESKIDVYQNLTFTDIYRINYRS